MWCCPAPDPRRRAPLRLIALVLFGALAAVSCGTEPSSLEGAEGVEGVAPDALAAVIVEATPSASAVPAPSPSPVPIPPPTPTTPPPPVALAMSVDADHAGQSFLGYVDGAGEVAPDGSWSLVLPDARTADRAAIGALELGVLFTRGGEGLAALAGPGPLPQPSVGPGVDDARARLAATIEVSGSTDGVIATARPPAVLEQIEAAAESVGLAPVERTSRLGVVLVLEQRVDLETVAAWPYLCHRNVPLQGGACGEGDASTWTETFDDADLGAWRLGDTDPLVVGGGPPEGTDSLAGVDGGVTWTNREAQMYRPDHVAVADGMLRIHAEHGDLAVSDLPPYRSGMVVGDDRFGWGRLEVDASVPSGAGLWPAIWWLPADVCDAPGRCGQALDPAYVEVDVIETIGHEPDDAHLSLHWVVSDEGADRIASTSTVATAVGLSNTMRTWSVEWRPGVIVWEIDGVVLATVSTGGWNGPVIGEPDHRLVLNLAVGGTFAGERILGPDSAWWGDSAVPPGYPEPGWETAELLVDEVRFTPID